MDWKSVSNYHCIDHCLHYEITQDFIDICRDNERLFKEAMRNSTHDLVLTEQKDFLGGLAQDGAFRVVREVLQIEPDDPRPYWNNQRGGDHGIDLIHRDVVMDIKASPMKEGWTHVTRKANLFSNISKRQSATDYFVFCKVDLANMVLHFPGMYPTDLFWQEKNLWTGKCTDPCNYIQAGQLKCWRCFMSGVPCPYRPNPRDDV